MSYQDLSRLLRAARTREPGALAAYDAALGRLERSRLPLWGDYDLQEVFKYANGDFTLDDVEETLADREGENDGNSWVALVKLLDGRFGVVDAGCDYTGWG